MESVAQIFQTQLLEITDPVIRAEVSTIMAKMILACMIHSGEQDLPDTKKAAQAEVLSQLMKPIASYARAAHKFQPKSNVTYIPAPIPT